MDQFQTAKVKNVETHLKAILSILDSMDDATYAKINDFNGNADEDRYSDLMFWLQWIDGAIS